MSHLLSLLLFTEPLPLSEYSRIITGKEIEDLKMDLRTLGKSYRVCGNL